MKYSFRQLEVFLAAAHFQNITRASESLSMSQSAASSALKELESQFDIQLFDRVGKRLQLNELGRLYRPKAEALLAEAENILNTNRYAAGTAREKAEAAEYEIRHAKQLAEQIQRVKMDERQWEQRFLTFEQHIESIADELNFDLRFDNGISAPVKDVKQAIQSLKEDRNSLAKEVSRLQSELQQKTQELNSIRETQAGLESQLEKERRKLQEKQRREERFKLVESLLKQELKVAIATNPIYPEEAVLRKLQWAELGTLIDSFSLISHASNTHFVKPSPAYYAELVACVGVEPDEVVMVGDRLENDIIPAQTVGINTFQIQSQPAKTKYSRSGTLEQFHKLIQSDFVWRTPSLSLKINMIEPQLLGNVAALLDTVEGVPSNFWQQHPEPDEWSMQQIVCHLWESEVNVQRPRLQRIGEEDDPFLIAPKPPSGPAELICDLPPHQYIERFYRAA